MSASPEEQALISLWRQGDQDAARQIVDRYIDRLLLLARRRISQRLSSRVDAEDIVQSVFRTFFHRVKEGQFAFAEQDDLCKLLVRITLHKTLRQVAFHKAAKRDPSQETDQGEHHSEQLMALLDNEPTPEATVAFVDQLEHFLGQLKPQEREILEMRLQGFSNDDIAKKLNIYDRKIRRVIEHIRAVAEKEGLSAPATLNDTFTA
jgi:RNA polymerase sigma-70 factor (ECF subfamily)